MPNNGKYIQANQTGFQALDALLQQGFSQESTRDKGFKQERYQDSKLKNSSTGDNFYVPNRKEF